MAQRKGDDKTEPAVSVCVIAYNSGPGDTQNRLENNLDLADEYASLVLNAYQRYKKIKHPAF